MPKKATESKKKFKPTPETVLAVESLQRIAEDDAAWRADEGAQLDALCAAVQRIEQLQGAQSFIDVRPKRTQSDLEALSVWARDVHGIDLESAGLCAGFVNDNGNEDNATLFAKRTISAGETMVTIPSDAILTASMKDIFIIARHGPAIARSPSLALSLTLLIERVSGETSKYAPYTNALPSTFLTPFASFNEDKHLYSALSPSTLAQASAVRTTRAQLRDYAGVFRAVLAAKHNALPISALSLKNFRWAISAVMTRQNALPNATDPSPRAQPTMALVPLWDLFNHANGARTTLVQLSGGNVSVTCAAMSEFAKGDAVTMCYGARPTPQLALYSGFVCEGGTPQDEVFVKIPLQSDDDDQDSKIMAPLKARVLARKGMSIDLDARRIFWCKVPVTQGEKVISKLVGVAAVAVMSKSDFTVFLKATELLPSKESILNSEYKEKAFKLAHQALETALAPYTTAYETRADAGVDWDSPQGKLITSLLQIESSILENAIEQIEQYKMIKEPSTESKPDQTTQQ